MSSYFVLFFFNSDTCNIYSPHLYFVCSIHQYLWLTCSLEIHNYWDRFGFFVPQLLDFFLLVPNPFNLYFCTSIFRVAYWFCILYLICYYFINSRGRRVVFKSLGILEVCWNYLGSMLQLLSSVLEFHNHCNHFTFLFKIRSISICKSLYFVIFSCFTFTLLSLVIDTCFLVTTTRSGVLCGRCLLVFSQKFHEIFTSSFSLVTSSTITKFSTFDKRLFRSFPLSHFLVNPQLLETLWCFCSKFFQCLLVDLYI